MTSPVVEDVTLSTNSAATSHTVDYPATVDPGDLLIVIFSCDDNETVTFPNEGTDWHTIYNEDAGPQGPTLAVAWRDAVGDEDGGSITVTTGTGEDSVAYMFRISGAADPSSQAPEATAEATGNDATPTPIIITPTGGSKDYLWIAAEGNDDDDATTAWPSNMADDNLSQTNNSVNLGVASEQSTAANFTPGTFTIASGETWECVTIAVHPPGAATYERTVLLDVNIEELEDWTGDHEGGSFPDDYDWMEVGASGVNAVDSIYEKEGTYCHKATVTSGSDRAVGVRIFTADKAIIVLGALIRFSSLPGSNQNNYFFQIQDADNTYAIRAGIRNDAGIMKLRVYVVGEALAYHSTEIDIIAGEYYEFQLKVYGHNTAGTIEMKLMGVSGVTETSLDTLPATAVEYGRAMFGNLFSGYACDNYLDLCRTAEDWVDIMERTQKTVLLDVYLDTDVTTYERTVLLDALLKAEGIERSLDLDVALQKLGLERTVLMDVALQEAGLERTVLLDAILQAVGVERSVDLDVVLSKIYERTVLLDTLLKALDIERSVDLDVALAKRYERTVDLDTLLKALDVEKSVDLDVLLKKEGIERTVLIDVLLKFRGTKTILLDLVLKAEGVERSVDLDIALQNIDIPKTVDLDTLLKALGVQRTVDLDVALSKIYEKSVDLDVLLKALGEEKTIDLDVLLKAVGVERTVLLDVFLKAVSVYQRTVDLDVLLKALGLEKSVDLDVLLKALGVEKSVDLDVALQEAGIQRTVDVDVLLQAIGLERSVDLDVALQKTGITRSVDLDVFLSDVTIYVRTVLLDLALKALSIQKTVLLDVYLSEPTDDGVSLPHPGQIRRRRRRPRPKPELGSFTREFAVTIYEELVKLWPFLTRVWEIEDLIAGLHQLVYVMEGMELEAFDQTIYETEQLQAEMIPYQMFGIIEDLEADAHVRDTLEKVAKLRKLRRKLKGE